MALNMLSIFSWVLLAIQHLKLYFPVGMKSCHCSGDLNMLSLTYTWISQLNESSQVKSEFSELYLHTVRFECQSSRRQFCNVGRSHHLLNTQHSPHGCRIITQFWRGGQRPTIWQKDYKASLVEVLCVPKSIMWGFWTFWTLKLTNFETCFWTRDTCHVGSEDTMWKPLSSRWF